MNQSNATVSVVRLGETCGHIVGNREVTLTIDPPALVSSRSKITADGISTADGTGGGLVDPFIEMDLEQLERLETALQSEEAKQILGENVTAMLGKLNLNVLTNFL